MLMMLRRPANGIIWLYHVAEMIWQHLAAFEPAVPAGLELRGLHLSALSLLSIYRADVAMLLSSTICCTRVCS